MKWFFTICFLLFFIPNDLKSQTVEVPFTALNIGCSFKDEFNLEYISNKQPPPYSIVIRNKEELIRLINCQDDYVFDFNKYIIIGIIGESGGCNSPIVSLKVSKEPVKNNYVIESTILQIGLCRMIFWYQSFISIEKPEENSSFEFKTIKDLYIKGDSPPLLPVASAFGGSS